MSPDTVRYYERAAQAPPRVRLTAQPGAPPPQPLKSLTGFIQWVSGCPGWRPGSAGSYNPVSV